MAEKRFRTAEDVIALIVRAAAKGSNLLLNIGPEGSGELPAPAVEVLGGVGRWFDRNGESVYGTEAAPFPTGKDVVATAKDDFVYLHFINPAVNCFAFRARGEVSAVTCLADGTAEMAQTFSGDVVVSVRRNSGYLADLVVKVVLR